MEKMVCVLKIKGPFIQKMQFFSSFLKLPMKHLVPFWLKTYKPPFLCIDGLGYTVHSQPPRSREPQWILSAPSFKTSPPLLLPIWANHPYKYINIICFCFFFFLRLYLLGFHLQNLWWRLEERVHLKTLLGLTVHMWVYRCQPWGSDSPAQ